MPKSKSSDLTDKYLGNLHSGSKASTQQHAKDLRHGETEAEKSYGPYCAINN